MKRKLIFDIDGVLLDHSRAFVAFLADNFKAYGLTEDALKTIVAHYANKPVGGFKFKEFLDENMAKCASKAISEFNTKSPFGQLSPFLNTSPLDRFARQADFAFVSSCGISPDTITMRLNNLHRHYGNIFKEAICLPALSSKYEAIKSLIDRDTSQIMFLDDHPKHIEDALDLKLNVVLVAHGKKESEIDDIEEIQDSNKVWHQVPVAHEGYELLYMIEKFIRRS